MTSAQVWTTAGVRLDLPAGWSDPPGVEWLAVIAALDQLGDPPAGLYSLLWNGHTTTSGAFKFRQRPGARASAVLRVISINRNGRSVREVVDDAAADIAGGSIDVARGRKGLPFGSVRFLEWEQPIRWGSIHIRAYFFGLHDAVGRVEVGTVGVPGRSLDTELRRILESVRASRG